MALCSSFLSGCPKPVVLGPIDWGLKKSTDGHRDYTVVFLIQTANIGNVNEDGISLADGPQTVLAKTPSGGVNGLPVIGTPYKIGNDNDPYALCLPDPEINPVHQRGEPHDLWTATFRFSTRYMERSQCDPEDETGNFAVKDPLSEPWIEAGTYYKFTKLADKCSKLIFQDSSGNILYSVDQASSGQPLQDIRNSAFEVIPLEVDDGRATLQLTHNYLYHPLTWDSTMGADIVPLPTLVNCVNSVQLWGFQPRCVKLSNYTYTRIVYGKCTYFYRITFDFDINVKTWDKPLADRGTQCLAVYNPKNANCNPPPWTQLQPNSTNPATDLPYLIYQNPANFERYADNSGELVLKALNGFGVPVGWKPPDNCTKNPAPVVVTSGAQIIPQYYTAIDFSRSIPCGLPTDLGNPSDPFCYCTDGENLTLYECS